MGENNYKGIVNSVKNILEQISNEAKKMSTKKDSLLKELNKDEKDSRNIEEVGLELITVLKKWNSKIYHTLDVLEKSIKQTNVDQINVFHTLANEITEFRRNNFVPDNKNILKNSESRDGLSNEDFITTEEIISSTECVGTNSLNNNLVEGTIDNNSLSISPTKSRINLSLNNESLKSQESEDEGWVDLLSKVIKTGMNKIGYG